MSKEVECMCLECGVSLYLDGDIIHLGDYVTDALRAVEKTFCTQCGGQLALVGLAGDEPNYRTRGERAAK
ncbi:hypothetical protein [Desulfoferrobacter suflitae]|uniref:hypothetical protein n=1 Tax=Desulfoferrobacter suflitae TaxID=2865782 RepID=UPI00216455E2|nr:hypothetical protein [Desulfoferrobacter suflitae]MCK8600444.1 hypothetical protein [Desulfoferrobacter suflitae]